MGSVAHVGNACVFIEYRLYLASFLNLLANNDLQRAEAILQTFINPMKVDPRVS
jgi:hypothetical protein